MTSKIVVNNIEPDAGISTVSILGIATATKFIGDVEGGVTGNVTGNVTGSSGSCTGNAATATVASGITTTASVNTSGIVTATAFVSGTPLSHRNIIINGAMTVAQRATSVTSITSTGYRTADRWGLSVTNAGTWTNTISTDTPDGFASSYKLDCTTADTSLGASDLLILYQVIEGYNVQGFAKGTSSAKEFTASFYIKTNKTGTYVVELYDADNNRQVSQSYTVSDTNWNRYIITFPADTTGAFGNDNGNSLYLQWWLASGTTYTSGTLNTSWASATSANRVSALNVNLADSTSNEWLITGIQLEIGSTATPFEHRSYGDELQRCQRYYTKLTGGGGNELHFTGSTKQQQYVCCSRVELPTTMRTAPSISFTGTRDILFYSNDNSGFSGDVIDVNSFNVRWGSSTTISDGASYTAVLKNNPNFVECSAEL